MMSFTSLPDKVWPYLVARAYPTRLQMKMLLDPMAGSNFQKMGRAPISQLHIP